MFFSHTKRMRPDYCVVAGKSLFVYFGKQMKNAKSMIFMYSIRQLFRKRARNDSPTFQRGTRRGST